jgi:NitT/TauT family transport system permease protein
MTEIPRSLTPALEPLPPEPVTLATDRLTALAAGGLALLALIAPLAPGLGWTAFPIAAGSLGLAAGLGLLVVPRLVGGAAVAAATVQTLALAGALLGVVHLPGVAGVAGLGFWIGLVGAWIAAWALIERLTAWSPTAPVFRFIVDVCVPLAFGAFLFLLWEVITVGCGVPMVLLPAPSQIAVRFAASLPILGADFFQTVVRAVIPGWLIGSAAGFAVALLADRVPFLGRGLIPLGDFVSALPIIGIAPIMVMWFGFDWQSKAAVVVIMTFFPMLVNTVAGLDASGRMERDLMRSWNASWWRTLTALRLPAAMPHVFAALKLNSTFALVGALVSEFFGTPIVGMGFRISTEVGRMGLDMVWAEIAMAAITGSTLYTVLALVEKRVTFWHPSNRGR